MNTRPFLPWLMISTIALLLMSGCGLLVEMWQEQGLDNPNLLLGNPSYAIANSNSPTNYLIVRPQYVMSYNRDRGTPNWASWQLNASWLGDLPRPDFAPDLELPPIWYQVKPTDYTGSGFDRGHVVPAADRDQTIADAQSVFVMSNIVPQAPDNNRGPWERLESYCRDLVQQGKELYIVAGSVGVGGTGERGRATTIARGQVTVPANLWKVVVVNDRPNLGLEGITEQSRVIAVIMPNQQGIKNDDWQTFRVSVDEVEALTGYDLLSNVSLTLQGPLEAKVDTP